MITVAVLIPTYGRAAQMFERVKPLLMQTPPINVQVAVILAIQEQDQETLQAAASLQAATRHLHNELHMVERKPGSTAVEGWLLAYEYAHYNDADWFVLGADDIIWRDGWLGNAMHVADKSKARVIGLNDLHTKLDDYAPHYMMRRDYADSYGFIPRGYKSWWFDREVCQTARMFNDYAPAWDAIAEHTHPDWRTAKVDETYRLGQRYHKQDQVLYEQRTGIEVVR